MYFVFSTRFATHRAIIKVAKVIPLCLENICLQAKHVFLQACHIWRNDARSTYVHFVPQAIIALCAYFPLKKSTTSTSCHCELKEAVIRLSGIGSATMLVPIIIFFGWLQSEMHCTISSHSQVSDMMTAH